jgi:Fe/S biogenesis protein NfuA
MADTDSTLDDGQIVIVTDAAREKIREIMEMQGITGRGAIRVGIAGRGPAGFNYSMSLEEDAQPAANEAVQDEGDFKVLVDGDSLDKLRGATVDFVGQLVGGGFKIDNPNSVWDDPLAAEIQALIDAEINPGVASHGGFVELLDVKDDKVFVRMGGGCQGCGMASVTLKQGVEVMIRQNFPQIQAVVDTTDHAGGENPYYQPSKGGQGASPFHAPAKG